MEDAHLHTYKHVVLLHKIRLCSRVRSVSRAVLSVGLLLITQKNFSFSEVQRTMLELLNQLDGFEATKNIKVRHLIS